MKFRLGILIALTILAMLLPQKILSAPLPPRLLDDPPAIDPAEEAILSALEERGLAVQSIQLVKFDVELQAYSQDNSWASAWLLPLHPQTGEPIPSEPGLAFAHRNGDIWNAILPSDTAFSEALATAPGEIISDTVRQTWLAMNQPLTALQPSAPISGYLLPWERGKTVYLSRSVAHDADFPSKNAHYSFDFYISRTMFNIHAARDGKVWMFYDAVENGDPDAPNYIVLEDTSTSPVTYQLYMHLAQYSIPAALKHIGASVSQGQFIGIADDTGMSTGHHLHFQVETLPYWTYWGKSVDITFNDVDINGGRPRVSIDFPYCTEPGDVCVTARSAYISGNIVRSDLNAPWGDLITPETGSAVSSATIPVTGWASDDQSGVASIQIKANFNDEWQNVGPQLTTSPFTYQWDMCTNQVPDGPVSVALEIRDQDGNQATGLPGLRHFIKDFNCPPPPSCNPGIGQAALFADTDYQGACAVFGIGSHDSSGLGALGNNNAASLKVGPTVTLTIFDGENLSGRSESFGTADASLDDNRVTTDTTSSLLIQASNLPPASPRLISPLPDETISEAADPTAILHWEDAGASTQFRVRWNGVVKEWQNENNYILGKIIAGAYTWQVQSRNAAGESGWSASQSFTVQTIDYPASSTYTAPYSDNMETSYNLWGRSRNWDQSVESNHTPLGARGWSYEVYGATGYDNGKPNFGDLTSPPINISATGYALRFWYRYESESPGRHWDQRWVQISVDGSPFTNLLQLTDDPVNYWLQSPAIDLSAFNGHTVRIRFHFNTLDALKNTYSGWFIDDFSISLQTPPGCLATGEPNDLPAQARLMSYGATLTGQICPAGDMDVYSFNGTAGDQIGVSVEALQPVTPDTMVFLLDQDGISVLASNDDRYPGVSTDSLLNYRLNRTGVYFIKVKAWDHPGSGGSLYTYTIKLYGNETIRPTTVLVSPPVSTFLPNGTVNLDVQTSDAGSGVSHVAYYWHPGDWAFADWSLLGMDWDGSNGWSFPFSTTSLPDQKDIAFYARSFDWAGNWSGAASWNLWLDRTPPVTSMLQLPLNPERTAILLQWNGSDNLSGIDYVDIQKLVGGNWVDWVTGISSIENSTWVIGQANQTYNFRMRAVDRIGNAEIYPTQAEASITIPANICSSGDYFETDNSQVSAKILSGVGNLQTHTFCNPTAGSGWLNDEDWYQLTVRQGERLAVLVHPLDVSSAARLQLYAADGISLLAEKAASEFGEPVNLDWRAGTHATVYLRVTHIDGRVAGNDVAYQIWARVGLPVFLPAIPR